jgi:hypothetical protein
MAKAKRAALYVRVSNRVESALQKPRLRYPAR